MQWQNFLLFFSILIACDGQLIVDTQYGPVRGAEKISALDRRYFSFQRIPYMKPPIDSLRFRDAVPPDSWSTPLDCTVEGPRFPQVDFTLTPNGGPFEGDLDSMHINVYTNNLTPTSKYPVMVWIHGGGFRTGSGSTAIYGPDYFMEKNVVLVTFNFRLHAFGHLSLDDPELNIPGNAAFKDQVMALKWVQKNIENFGGDAGNVTIFGQSTGGSSCHYHSLSPLSKGLFQRVIPMSGNAFNPIYSAIPRRNWAFRLATALNYTGSENEREILAFLEMADPEAMFFAARNLLTQYESDVEQLRYAFGPVIEPFNSGNAFMLSHPEELAVNSWGNDIDMMIGATSFEIGMLVPVFLQFPQLVAAYTNFSTFIPYRLNRTDEEKRELGEMLEQVYFGYVPPSGTNFDGVILLYADFSHWHVIDRVVKQRLRSNAQGATFVYRFDANADNNCFRELYGIDKRWHANHPAIHMDDLCYLFMPSFVNVPLTNSTSFELIHHMLDVFTTFSSVGNPGMANWVKASNISATLSGYNIKQTRNLDTFGEFPEQARIPVWEKIYEVSASPQSRVFDSLTIVMSFLTVVTTIKI